MKQVAEAAVAVALAPLFLLAIIVTAIIGGGGGPAGTGGGQPAVGALAVGAGVPAAFQPWVIKAGGLCPQESPALIAAQIWAESQFQTTAVGPMTSSGQAKGPAQFMAATFAAWGRDDDSNGVISATDIGDAVMAEGRLMCSLLDTAAKSGFPAGTVALALAGYNAGWQAVQKYVGIPPYPETTTYIHKIMAKAAEWTATVPTGVPRLTAGTAAGVQAVRRAQTWVGTPYAYGGGTPAGPSVGFCDGPRGMLAGVCFATSHAGFDCSSLTQLAWWSAVQLPRTAAGQYSATSTHAVPLAALQPGDLLFYQHGKEIDHVALYAGGGKVVQAPSTGKNVEVVDLYTTGFVAATRPT